MPAPAPDPSPEVTAVEVCAALSATAPPDLVIALDTTTQRVIVAAAHDLRHWRTGAWLAVLVATRPEIHAALAPEARRDITAIDTYAAALTEHTARLLNGPPAA